MGTRFIMSSDAAALRAALDEHKGWLTDSPKMPTVTVEAEYGNEVVEGSFATLAHHGPRSGVNPCPCTRTWHDGRYRDARRQSIPRMPEGSLVGLSHLDLDALGGIMALAGHPAKEYFCQDKIFWEVAAALDIQGADHLPEILDDKVVPCDIPWEVLKLIEPDCEAKWFSRSMITLGKLKSVASMVEGQIIAWWVWYEVHQIRPPDDGSVIDVTEHAEEAMEAVVAIINGYAKFWRPPMAS